jgi:hypothetical protein
MTAGAPPRRIAMDGSAASPGRTDGLVELGGPALAEQRLGDRGLRAEGRGEGEGVAGLARIARLAPVFRLRIPIRGLGRGGSIAS